MKNNNVKNKILINRLYSLWCSYKKLLENSTTINDVNLYRIFMFDIVCLYSDFVNSNYDATLSLFECAYAIGFDELCKI